MVCCPNCGWHLSSLQGFEHSLTNKQRIIFETLLKAKGGTVTRDKLVWEMYHGEDEPDGSYNVLSQMIMNIRKKIKRAGLPIEIESMRPGFRLRSKNGDPSSNNNQGNSSLDK
jgi:DNA-binding response OmpR family regulator